MHLVSKGHCLNQQSKVTSLSIFLFGHWRKPQSLGLFVTRNYLHEKQPPLKLMIPSRNATVWAVQSLLFLQSHIEACTLNVRVCEFDVESVDTIQVIQWCSNPGTSTVFPSLVFPGWREEEVGWERHAMGGIEVLHVFVRQEKCHL